MFFTLLHFKLLLEVISSYMLNVGVQLCILLVSRLRPRSCRTLCGKHNCCLKWMKSMLSLPRGYEGDQSGCNMLLLSSVRSEEIISFNYLNLLLGNTEPLLLGKTLDLANLVNQRGSLFCFEVGNELQMQKIETRTKVELKRDVPFPQRTKMKVYLQGGVE